MFLIANWRYNELCCIALSVVFVAALLPLLAGQHWAGQCRIAARSNRSRRGQNGLRQKRIQSDQFQGECFFFTAYVSSIYFHTLCSSMFDLKIQMAWKVCDVLLLFFQDGRDSRGHPFHVLWLARASKPRWLDLGDWYDWSIAEDTADDGQWLNRCSLQVRNCFLCSSCLVRVGIVMMHTLAKL